METEGCHAGELRAKREEENVDGHEKLERSAIHAKIEAIETDRKDKKNAPNEPTENMMVGEEMACAGDESADTGKENLSEVNQRNMSPDEIRHAGNIDGHEEKKLESDTGENCSGRDKEINVITEAEGERDGKQKRPKRHLINETISDSVPMKRLRENPDRYGFLAKGKAGRVVITERQKEYMPLGIVDDNTMEKSK